MTMEKRKFPATVSFQMAGTTQMKASKSKRNQCHTDDNDSPYLRFETEHGSSLQPVRLERLQSGELAVVSTLCNMEHATLNPYEESSWPPATKQRATVVWEADPPHHVEETASDVAFQHLPSSTKAPILPTRRGLGHRLQTPDKAAVTALYNMAHAGDDTTESSSSSSLSSVRIDDAGTSTDTSTDDDNDSDNESSSIVSIDENPRPTKKRRPRDPSKPTLETLVRDKFDGEVFSFLAFVENEMKQHDFTATGLARKLDAENCQSRFRTICAELREESIVGISRLWRERVKAYLRTRQGAEEGLAIVHQYEDRIRRVGTIRPAQTSHTAKHMRPTIPRDTEHGKPSKSAVKVTKSNQPPSSGKKKRKRRVLDDGAKTTLEKILEEKFNGDAFQFLAFVENEVNEGTSATGIAKKLNAVNCQSRFRTIVAELKQKPIVGMSRLWKERVQTYFRAKESQQQEKQEHSAGNRGGSNPDPLRIVHENPTLKSGVSGSRGIQVVRLLE